MKQESFEVGAYFYPLTTYCASRDYRAWQVGDALGYNDILSSPNEFEIIKDAPALFASHDQPRTYTLGDGRTEWDDHHDLIQQIALAHTAGISFFVFDSYTGFKNGEPYEELTAPLDRLLQIGEVRKELCIPSPLDLADFKYARMEALESPRVIMPIPPAAPGFGSSFAEPSRGYDITPESARHIIDKNIPHWNNPQYLRVGDRPYLSILMPDFGGAAENVRKARMERFMDGLRAHAFREYGENPYIVGVIRAPEGDAGLWLNLDVDAITHYSFLSDYSPGAPHIQEYSRLAAGRQRDWEEVHALAKTCGRPFVPSPSVGWDASPRGERGHAWEEVAGKHPYSPIVVGNGPEEVAAMLGQAIDFACRHVPEGERLIPLFAWNEIGEGATLLPRLRPDDTIDRSYLEAVRRTITAAKAAAALALK